jgi:predicted O-linked N-acetylglucosamine transferase (SPINDLY family)
MSSTEILIKQAISLHQQGNLVDAEAVYKKVLSVHPKNFDALHMLGIIYAQRDLFKEAEKYLRKAIAIDGSVPPCLNNYGIILCKLSRFDEAIDIFKRAIRLAPNHAGIYSDSGLAFSKLKRHAEAAVAFTKALEINPEYPFAKGLLLHQKMQLCDWVKIDDLIAQIEKELAAGKSSADPFGWQGVAKSERSLHLCAKIYNKNRFPADIKPFISRRLGNNQKIRIGYLSGEFRDQATSHLLAGVIENHDKSRFQIYAIDNGWDDRSKIRSRIVDSMHCVINIKEMRTSQAVNTIREENIDLLINLNGYFGEERTEIFAQKAAPIQINYLGFPGTLGADYIDYIIADQCVIPPNHREFYTEKVVYLPNCYQANDTKREIGSRIFRRLECGLPEKGFVFCCFNNSYKIMPDTFDSWMRILSQTDASVLWLLEDNATAANNLKKEAVARGIGAERLIFAKRMALNDHLARHRLADLFLDTLPYNAHTTASDALWAGLPVLTCTGNTFAGRVATSILNAIHLPELIATTREAYEQMAIDLATHPEKLGSIKQNLAENRFTTPFFDTKLFTKHIEVAYTAMYERHQAGLAPDHIAIPS